MAKRLSTDKISQAMLAYMESGCIQSVCRKTGLSKACLEKYAAEFDWEKSRQRIIATTQELTEEALPDLKLQALIDCEILKDYIMVAVDNGIVNATVKDYMDLIKLELELSGLAIKDNDDQKLPDVNVYNSIGADLSDKPNDRLTKALNELIDKLNERSA